jgi:hypothetical protein
MADLHQGLAGHWTPGGKNSHRAGLGDRRNKITAALFEEAAA